MRPNTRLGRAQPVASRRRAPADMESTGMNAGKLALAAESAPAVPFAIPGATGEFRIQVLNQDAGAGVVTSIIHLPPGGRIPAHRHGGGAKVLTVQSWQSRPGDHDFELAEAATGRQDGMQPVDQPAQEQARRKAAEPGAKGYA
jgi:hypothetical protein